MSIDCLCLHGTVNVFVRWYGCRQAQLGFGCNSSTEIVCYLATSITAATGIATCQPRL